MSTISCLFQTYNIKVGLILFSDDIVKYIPPKKGKSHVLRLITDLVNHNYDKKQSQTSIKKALEFASKISKRKNVMFIISDFMDKNFWTEMKYLNFNHDVIGVQIYDMFEKEFPDLGLIQVHNSESNERIWIDTSNEEIRSDFSKDFSERLNDFAQKCKNIGFDLIQIGTNEDYIKALTHFFKRRAKRT